MPQNQIFPVNPSEIPNLKFQGVPGFKPNYTPRDMLLLGVFNGTFFNTITSRRGLPESLWADMAPSHYESLNPDVGANFFEVLVPIRNRAMDIPSQVRLNDPGGWFQWYCKFYYGRRTEGDGYRINQWRKEVVTLFHAIKFGIPINIQDSNAPYVPPEGQTAITDLDQFKEARQQLLHFGWDSRRDPMDYGLYL